MKIEEEEEKEKEEEVNKHLLPDFFALGNFQDQADTK